MEVIVVVTVIVGETAAETGPGLEEEDQDLGLVVGIAGTDQTLVIVKIVDVRMNQDPKAKAEAKLAHNNSVTQSC